MKQKIIDQFEAIVLRYAGLPAISGHEEISYTQLRDKALRFAAFLQNQNIGASEPRIVLNLPKSNEYIIALMGCMYAGWVFTPLEPSLPEARKKFIIDDIQPHLVVDVAVFQRALAFNADDFKAIDYGLNHLAYIIYTSGSTGQPKGVMVEHKGLYNVISQQIIQFDIKPEDRVFLLLSISFDASLSDIFCTLLSGACLHIEEGDKQLVASDLPAILNKRQITHIDIPPSMLRILDPGAMPKSLRSLIIGGEICPIETVQKWADKYLLNNVYGPTEVSICTSMITCEADKWNRPLIGQPMANVDYVIDGGELLIGGVQVARGYWNRPELTASKFVTFNKKGFYRTGDHVRLEDDGEYCFLGRIDRQVKIRGQLVELEEVEKYLLSHPLVTRGVAVAREDLKGKKQLIAFYQSENKQDIDAINLQEHMAQNLTDWMIPSFFKRVDEFTLTASGKIDAAQLEFVFDDNKIDTHNIQLPQNERQQKLWDIWADILKREDFGIEDSFFALGGDSIDAIDFTMRAAKEHMAISPSMLSKHFTIIDIDGMLGRLDVFETGMCVDELRALVRVPKVDAIYVGEGDATFLTGATGFLGARLLHDLLSVDDKRYICLVRAQNEHEGLLRIEQALARHGLGLGEADKKRIQIICGDFTSVRFGLSEGQWGQLSRSISSIIHCGAIVNMVKSFDDLRAANFDACIEIMRLALSAQVKNIDYISTLSVFVSTDQNTGTVVESDMLDNIGQVYGGYAQTKVAAELALHHKDFAKHCHVTSYRLGLITGDTKTGASAPHDFLSTFLHGIKQLGCTPEGDFRGLEVDVTPVDFASECLARLINLDDKQDCYHIANKQGFNLPQMMNGLRARGHECRVIAMEDWKVLPQSRTLNAQEQAAWLGLCRVLGEADYKRYRSMDLFQATNMDFDMTMLKKDLGGVDFPHADINLLELYLLEMGL